MIVARDERCPCNLPPPGAKSASEDKLNVLGLGGGGMGVATGCCMHYTVYEIILLLICINSYDFL